MVGLVVGVATTAGAAPSAVGAQPRRTAATGTPTTAVVLGVPVAAALPGCAPTVERAATILVVSILADQPGEYSFTPQSRSIENVFNARETFAAATFTNTVGNTIDTAVAGGATAYPCLLYTSPSPRD